MSLAPGPFADRFDESYLRLCLKQGRSITAQLEACIGDFLLGPDGLRLYSDPSQPPTKDEVVVPDLDRILNMLRTEAPIVVLDTQIGDFGVTAFDEYNRSLANVVSHNAPEACMRALLFVTTEKRANEMTSGMISLNPVSNRSDS
ncbi:MAG: hypothetical protein WBW04_10395 [Nitrolancea sp.]